MTSDEKKELQEKFKKLLEYKSEEEELKHEAKLIMFKFLSEIEKLQANKPFLRNKMAKILKVSASYVTQLFTGSKLINFLLLAKIQKGYNLTFEINAVSNDASYQELVENEYANIKPKKKKNIASPSSTS